MVSFDVALDEKCQPQAANISVTGGTPRPREARPPPPQQFQQQYAPPPYQDGSMPPPAWMPPTAMAVTLHGKPGWFVSQESVYAPTGPRG